MRDKTHKNLALFSSRFQLNRQSPIFVHMSEWKVKVNQKNDYRIKQQKDELLIDEKPAEIDLLQIDKDKFHLIRNGKSYSASLIDLDQEAKKLKIKINNRMYELDVEDQFDQLLQRLGMDDLVGAAIGQLKAPMPGLVLQLMVEEGQSLAKDESMLILEAMKMENVLKAPADVTIKKINVEEKQSVEKNQVLIEFE